MFCFSFQWLSLVQFRLALLLKTKRSMKFSFLLMGRNAMECKACFFSTIDGFTGFYLVSVEFFKCTVVSTGLHWVLLSLHLDCSAF